MKVENAKAQMRKGVLEFCILNILKNKEAYPSEIIEELRAAKLTVVEGTIYPLLTRLKNSGVLEYRWVESKSGPPRKYYKLSKQGNGIIKELSATWQQLSNAVTTLTNSNK